LDCSALRGVVFDRYESPGNGRESSTAEIQRWISLRSGGKEFSSELELSGRDCIAVMQSTESRQRNNLVTTQGRWRRNPAIGSILRKSEMSPVLVVITNNNGRKSEPKTYDRKPHRYRTSITHLFIRRRRTFTMCSPSVSEKQLETNDASAPINPRHVLNEQFW